MAFTSGNDINVIQSTDKPTVGAGAGNDTYILSPFTLSGTEKITISDTQGTNSLQLVGGLQIASSQVAADALFLKLTNGSEITILGASSFFYEPGGNKTAGIDNADVNYATFALNTLGVTVPSGGNIASGGPVTIPGGGLTPTYALAAGATNVNEGNSVTFTLTTTNVAAGTVLNYTLAGTGITVTDFNPNGTTGTVTVLAGGVTPITVTTAADLTTEGPENFTLALNGGLATSGAVTINDTSLTPSGNTISVNAVGTFAATAGNDVFTVNISGASGGLLFGPGFNGTAVITGFDTAHDILRFVNTAGGTATESNILTETGVNVLEDPFTPLLTYVFNPDGLSNESTIQIAGLAAQNASFIEVV